MMQFYANGEPMAFWKGLSKVRYNNSFFAPLSPAQGEISNFPFSLKPGGDYTFSLMKKYAKTDRRELMDTKNKHVSITKGVECSPRFGTILLESKNSPPTGGSNSLDSLTSTRPESLTATHPKADGRACANKDSLCNGALSVHQWNARSKGQVLFGLSSTDGRLFFGHALGFLRDMFDKCSTAVRQSFDWASTRSRRTVEAHPKKTRSCPEAVSNESRSGVEQFPKRSRRKNLVFIPFFNRASKVKDSYEIDTVHAPLVYGECTKSVLLVYRKGTKEVLQRYWRSTKELLNVCTFPVHQKYVKSRGAVQPTRGYTESTVRSLRLIAYRLMLKIKSLQPIAYGLLLIFVSMFSLSDAWAQSAESRAAEGQTDIKPLQIGDTIPEELWHMPMQVVNHPEGKDTITLNDYRDKKLIILDFWATWCGSCLASLNKLPNMQEKFKSDVQITPVTYEGRALVKNALKKQNFPNYSVIENSILSKYIPHHILPYHVYILDNKIYATTSIASYLNAENLKNFVLGKPVKIFSAMDRNQGAVASKNLPNNSSHDSQALYKSEFTRRSANVSRNVSKSKTDFRIYNMPINDMIKVVFESKYDWITDDKRWVIELGPQSKDKIVGLSRSSFEGNYQTDSIFQAWLDNNTYCYTLSIGKETPEQMVESLARKNLKAVLLTIHGLSLDIVTQPVACYVLRKTDHFKPQTNVDADNRNLRYVTNLINHRAKLDKVLTLESSLLNYSIPINMTELIENPDVIHARFNELGLYIEEELKPMELLVLREVNQFD
ncbi:redoxin family protein [Sphingobacterium wenxiniae]|uniref:AhpC/TSA family protein n=1 Tax=Sphingobacterium wenxiniae TaxID=683125 RepID=A0A1I6VQ55_9SPHI|nr:redoxin family protein [Sphingobacterium wenxiniae]SFT15836.1 AhpC/TSA family protein [Sphingobacterium wenxiniae]